VTKSVTSTDEHFLAYVRSVRLANASGQPAESEILLRSLFGRVGLGSSLIYFNPWDFRAWQTWAQISFPPRLPHLALFRAILRQLLRDFRPFPHQHHNHVACARRHPGVVILLRHQKLILVDRLHNHVFHILRDEYRDDRHLLESEAKASLVLPDRTIPLLYAHTHLPPRFLVQPFVLHTLQSWREWLPRFHELLEALFAYYSHFGFREVHTTAYLNALVARCRERLRTANGPPARELEYLLEQILRHCGTRLATPRPPKLLLTRVHGDFIPAHIVAPARAADPNSFALTDWSESHDYSAFHDLFYFHFQNYDSDFVEQVLALQPEQMPSYFGTGAEWLAATFRRQWQCALSAEYLQLNFLVCFVQELDHRIFRLRGHVLDFWKEQARRMLRVQQ
jgi:hypothetical protein